MTQEDKSLLLKDLCARLPYGVKVNGVFLNYNKDKGKILYEECDKEFNYEHLSRYETLKPYLFPLSSMTKEQAKEMQEIIGNPDNACIIRKTYGLELWLNYIDTDPTIWVDTIFEVQDYLNKNHFDYRGLIEKGLAIDATGLNIY